MFLPSFPVLRKACTVVALATLLIFLLLHVICHHDKDDLQLDDSARPLPAGRDDDTRGLPSNHRQLFHIYDAQTSLPDRFRLIDLRTRRKYENERTENDFNCTDSKTVPSFKICVYEPHKDKFISAGLLSSGLWEPYITKAFQMALSNYPQATVIDVGANIGYYSHLASAMGHKVIALEPQEANVKRFIAGALADHWSDNTILLANVLSDTHTNVTLTQNLDNQGGIQVTDKCGQLTWGQSPWNGGAYQPPCQIPTLTLDDLLYIVTTKTAIIKVDIEGYECRAMATASGFFSTITVPYIFMEWRQMRERQHFADTACRTQQIWALSHFLADMGYSPYEIRSGIFLNPYSAPSWKVGDVYWRAKGQNLLVPSL